jgi:3-hydroxy-9,10-secoandrosta-1,3,5(10)-triene-9,17-dione monooxygenase
VKAVKRETPGFSDVGYDEALRRAQALIPFLREQAPICEAARTLTPEVVDALHRNGLFRYLQPRMWGGMELPFVAYFDIPEMLARGDIAVAWVVANLGSHHRNLVWWPREAQEDVWGTNPDAGIAAGIAYPQGRSVATEGGIVLGGEWNFSSGTDHSEWTMLASTLREDERPVDYVMSLVPRSQYEVVDDWHTLGMRATSSKTVRCKDLFVPQHRVISMYLAKPGHSWPGLEVHRNPHYRLPTSAIGGHTIGGCIVGHARAALETSIEMVKARSTSYTGAKMRDFQTVQLRIAAAGAKIDAAALLLRNDCLEAQRIVEEGGMPDIETKLRYKRNCAMAAKFCIESVDSLHEMAGGNGIYEKYPLERMLRDIRAAAGHFSFSVDAQLPAWALVTLGGEFKSPTL